MTGTQMCDVIRYIHAFALPEMPPMSDKEIIVEGCGGELSELMRFYESCERFLLKGD